MNTNSLAKLYDRLTPAERLPLIVAAGLRDDTAERQRLMNAAPRIGLSLPDYFPLGAALQEVADFHVTGLLNLAANFWQAWGLWGWSAGAEQRKDRGVRSRGRARYHAYEFTTYVAAWVQFCCELQVEPEALVDCTPGYEIIRQTHERAADLAYDREAATVFLRLSGQETALPPAVEGQVGALHTLYRERAAWWDGQGA